MTAYWDLFVIPVPRAKIADYRRLGEMSADVWLGCGATSYVEVEGDDVKPGKLTSFPQSVVLKPDETVIVALIGYRSRAHRDEVNAKAMADPRIAEMKPATMPFDAMRMFWGGFKPFIGAPATQAVQPYLFFRGRCAEAIGFYEKTLGARVEMMMRFKDNPDHPEPDKVPAELADRIMHASLNIAGSPIMMSDGMRSGPLDFACMSLSLQAPTEAECDRWFNALSEGGKVQMPLGPTFFAKRFGAVEDKFGVSWMIIVPQPVQAG